MTIDNREMMVQSSECACASWFLYDDSDEENSDLLHIYTYRISMINTVTYSIHQNLYQGHHRPVKHPVNAWSWFVQGCISFPSWPVHSIAYLWPGFGGPGWQSHIAGVLNQIPNIVYYTYVHVYCTISDIWVDPNSFLQDHLDVPMFDFRAQKTKLLNFEEKQKL